MIDIELSNSHYIIDTEVRNEGIKYADNFFVASRYCLYQIGPNKSHLKVTCEVRYIKSVMMIIKCLILFTFISTFFFDFHLIFSFY